MLRHLAIRDFAIISEVEIDIEPGFTAITGETGAGKSILVDALGLLLGDRAESGLIAGDARQAELEAVFSLTHNDGARRWLAEQALDEGEELIIRRVLTAPSGSRAWINGRSATVGQLAELGEHLVEIHGQHEHQRLGRAATQRRLLDARVAADKLDTVRETFRRWQDARAAMDEFERNAGDPQQLELLQFQVRELVELDLGNGEYEQLETEQERLARADDIRLALASAGNALDSELETAARGLIRQALAALEPVRELQPDLEETAGMLEEAGINIDEALASIERLASGESGDPERLDQVNRRLETALDLARKHRIRPAELPTLTDTLSQRLEQLENQGQRRAELEAELGRAETAWLEAAKALSKARQKAAKSLAEAVARRLEALGMATAGLAFEVDTDNDARPSPEGIDRVTITFSANPGQALQPLSKIASGGELSRVALALMLAAEHGRTPRTRIFDEVDAGVGGETAHAVGRFLREVAGDGQAMCVTHLAQVAACADHQFSVAKHSSGQTTAMQIQALGGDERRREIARMLGSAESEKSLAHAAEMLEKSVSPSSV
ncbi:DNA repair protein RecN [Wenzhouxiangella sp. XN201]|uniref:DNA repair protein RecN n=1 Tax=Wenzhouxiangella sp. XN201 TaxID=2710755 RepID=UPI0013C56214|nr:DNA repair protein RecN [Wenzhouxiangella sp. XN201]NEZ04149.1 DNA repair protein RecN [Wenzhouxiangella sp. XN201]